MKSPSVIAVDPGQRPYMRGLTLIELLVTLAVLAIVAAAAMPAFDSVTMSNRLTTYGNEFIAAAQAARSEAIKRNANVVMCASSDGSSCLTSGGWQVGWVVFHDPDNDGVLDSGETVIQTRPALQSGYLFKASSGALVARFDGTGALSNGPLTFKLCRSTPSVGSSDRQVDLSLTGRATLSKTSTGTCS